MKHQRVGESPIITCFLKCSPSTEFTEHQRNVFCVFSGRGVTDLRTHLNKQIQYQEDEYDNDTVNDADDDQTMTGMMGAAALNVDDEDADGDEELDADVEGA